MKIKDNKGPDRQGAICTVSYVADFNRRYPGEDVTFHARVEALEPLSGFTLRITLVDGLVPGVAHSLDGVVPQIAVDEGTYHLIWTVGEEVEPGTRYDYQVKARVAALEQDRVLKSYAVATASPGNDASLDTDDDRSFSDRETTAITVSTKGRYLRHLPAIYDKDDLMGRFLMLFESFWTPIDGQIGHLPAYFDPKMAPPDFLPWLASWFDLTLDQRWPEDRRRQLLRSVASLYRKRGARDGLKEYLEIFTGEKVEIIEHRAHNFTLGAGARLGPGIALGTDNEPHTFTVIVHSLPVATEEDDARASEEQERRRIVRAIIEAEKPAYTGYTLHFESDQATQVMSRRDSQTVDLTEGSQS